MTVPLRLLLWGVAVVEFVRKIVAGWPWSGYDLIPVQTAGRALVHQHPLFTAVNPDYLYPPAAALVVGAPLAPWSQHAVFRAGLVVGCLLLTLLVALSARVGGLPATGTAAAAVLAALAVSGAGHMAVGLENVTLLVAPLAAGAFLAEQNGRPAAAGCLLGLSLALKPLLLPLWVGLVLVRRWRTAAVAAGMAVAANAAALAVDPHALAGIGGRLGALVGGGGMFLGYFELMNGSIANIGAHLLHLPGPVTVLLRVGLPAAAVLGAVRVWRVRPEPARTLEASALVLAGSFLAAGVFEVGWLLVVVPCAFAAAFAGSPLRRPLVAVGAVFAFQLVVLPPTGGLVGWSMGSVATGLGLALVVVAAAFPGRWPAAEPSRHVAGTAATLAAHGLPGAAAGRR